MKRSICLVLITLSTGLVFATSVLADTCTMQIVFDAYGNMHQLWVCCNANGICIASPFK